MFAIAIISISGVLEFEEDLRYVYSKRSIYKLARIALLDADYSLWRIRSKKLMKNAKSMASKCKSETFEQRQERLQLIKQLAFRQRQTPEIEGAEETARHVSTSGCSSTGRDL